MSARGARSRKVQQKDIEKKEHKAVGKGKAPETIQEVHDAFTDWRPSLGVDHPRSAISRSLTVSSSSSHANTRTSSAQYNSSQPKMNNIDPNRSSELRATRATRSSGGGSASISDSSSKGKEKTKFQAKGKETRAPRGRGGGVPIKRTIATSPAPPIFRTESALSYASINQKNWINFKVWEGGKDGLRPYGGFEHDDDMQNGTVLIYFKEEQIDDDRPLPSIRADLAVLQKSGSAWLNNALAYGQIDNNVVDDWDLSYDSQYQTSSRHFSPNFSPPRQDRMLGPTSPGGRSPPPFDIDQAKTGIDSRSGSRLHYASDVMVMDRSNSPPPFRRSVQRDPTHEIWFTAPNTIRTPQGQRLHHVAIRNFLAMLHGKAIVGADLFEMLNTLQPEIQVMYDLDSGAQSQMTPRERSVQLITNYLGQHGLVDVRNNVRHALGILAWSEQENVKWRQGYLESFVHLVGTMTPQMEELADFKRLSIVTRRNLGLASKTLQLHVMEAEEKLAGFDFMDLWEDTAKTANNRVYQSYQALRQFLVAHYTRIFGSWPPATNKTWLNRKIVHALQEDFGSLYDYIVDRDVIWNPREERASRKWEMAHRRNDVFKADLPELGMTDMLVTFDAKHGYAHIPHPYPLLPREVPTLSKEKEKKSFFSSLKKDKIKDITKDAKAHLQLSIVFSDATNIEKLDVNFNGSTLIDKFEQFELTTDLKHTSPREARLGRWVLLYGILQVLSTLSVDVQGLKHTDDVRYFLCTDLKRLPDWVTNGQIEHCEASQQRSWCWQRAWDPKPAQTAPVELEASSIAFDRRSPAEQEVEVAKHAFPSPPPNRQLPHPPPSLDGALDGATLMQNDIRQLSEKIDSLSLSHNATQFFRQDLDRRRANEKAIQSEFLDRKAPTTYNPRMDSLGRLPDSSYRSHSRMDNAFRLTESDFRPPAPRSHVDSLNTDLGAYPFSPNDVQHVQWPVPPGYHESNYRESTVLGSGYGSLSLSADGLDDHRNPRRPHERAGWS